MAGSLENRLRRLEGDNPKPCPACGDDGTPADMHFEVAWEDETDRSETGEPERCPECGRPLEVIIRWPDVQPET